MVKALASIALGATLGAWLRWLLSIKFNALWVVMPLGTYLANSIAGYIAGLALAFFTHWPNLSPEWRLFVLTGFCGALSTFSSFSLVVFESFQHERIFYGLLTIFLHVFSALSTTASRLLSYMFFRSYTV